ncbi:type IV toxin-antitoxin system AbiEi family antitoxin domain-containing protein [Geotalea sp. SG265]|uniref:type IV toxin-antitoxin system AbiEi family antitoxin domain-containing protein n=1 Tax=Geotalea sp. SG265 TaxID=2922867 RepID=UPI001FAEF96F|nr:type IV toxin-antitoxin system AbiEi family antitoxin domain-containing protein [Geotalea sp. SG265]
MPNLAERNGKNLRKSLHIFPTGMPITSTHLAQWGVSRQLAHWYKLNGWFEPLGQGYYLRVGDKLTETGAIAALEANGVMVHLAGKSALDLRGFSHYLPLGCGTIYLYGRHVRKVPKWLTDHFAVEISSGKLFNEDDRVEQRMFVRRMDPNDSNSPYASDPERAILEMLDNVPLKQTLEGAKLIMESMFLLDSEKMLLLLQACLKIKVKRLFISVATELGLPVTHEINTASIDFGASTPYTIRGRRGGKTLVLKNPHFCAN